MQDEVEKALRRLQWQGPRILAAGRTDSGVHATGQVIAFDLDWRHSSDDLRQALNACLPRDIVARQVRQVNSHFNPRRDAQARQYQYRIFSQDVRDPLRERYAWRVWPPAELGLLQQAASALTGRHDFHAFGTPPQAGGSTLRTVIQAGWQKTEEGLEFEVTADAFLYHMARRMVALQVAIGQKQTDLLTLAVYLDPLQAVSENYVQGLAPPQGLCLTAVDYPAEKLALD